MPNPTPLSPKSLCLTWCGLFGLFLITGFGLRAQFGGGDSSDYQTFYRPVAERVVGGQGITEPSGEPALRYPPGYSLLLAAPVALSKVTGADIDMLVQLFIAGTLATTGAVLLTLHRERFGRRVAWLGLACWVTYPILLWLTKDPIVDVPYTLVLALTALMISRSLLRGQSEFVAAGTLGALVGIGSLIRPNGIVLIIPCVVSIYWASKYGGEIRVERHFGRRGFLSKILVFLVVSGATLAPWMSWASVKQETLVPLSTNGPSTIRAGLEVGGGRNEEVGSTWMLPGAREFARRTIAQPQLTTTGAIRRYIGSQLLEHPGDAASMFSMKAIRSWYGTDSFRWDSALALIQGVYLALIVWAVARTRRTGGTDYLAFIFLTTALFWFTCISVVSIVRYMVPVLTLLVWLIPLCLPMPTQQHVNGRLREEVSETAS